MLKTRRYKTIWDDSRRFVGFDRLRVDPGTTDRLARLAVDSSEVDELVAEFKGVELNEENYIKWATLKARLALAVKRYEYAVAEYARANPVHFEPRENEEIVCPLIEQCRNNRI